MLSPLPWGAEVYLLLERLTDQLQGFTYILIDTERQRLIWDIESENSGKT
jgi:hypothetical protein